MEITNINSRSLKKELFIKATPERVFQTLTDKGYLERWFLTKAEVDLCLGGEIRFYWGLGVFQRGKILVLEPPHRLCYTWEAQSPSFTTVTFELAVENDGTLLHLSQTGIGEGEDWDSYSNKVDKGWNIHLKNLIVWLETGKERTW